MDSYEAQALAHYWANGGTEQPTEPLRVLDDDEIYIVLENVRGTLAVYIVTDGDQVELVDDPPKRIAEDPGDLAPPARQPGD